MTWIINGEWEAVDKLGSGSFGDVYRAKNLNDSDRFAAVKMEKVRDGVSSNLNIENEFYKKVSGIAGFPSVFFYGKTPCGKYRALVMDLLGKSLEKLTSKTTLSTKTVLMIGIQGLRRLESIHNRGFIHRDIKPDNMLIGDTDPDTVYVADFGIAKRFKKAHNRHIPKVIGKGFSGTSRYASINSHIGKTKSRRDDLESFGYTLVALLTGTLPWAGAGAKTFRIKGNTSISDLCKDCPSNFEDYFRHVLKLGYDERPNYAYLKDLLKNSLLRRNLEDDRKFDWMQKKAQRRHCSRNR